MPVRTQIIEIITQVGREQEKQLAPLVDELALLDSGLDSLCLAIIVARLEDSLAVDPFSGDEEVELPTTVGDLIRLYERAAG
jgi:acyl carrier protein